MFVRRDRAFRVAGGHLNSPFGIESIGVGRKFFGELGGGAAAFFQS